MTRAIIGTKKDNPANHDELLNVIAGVLPPLPRSLRYYDDFDDTRVIIKNFDSSEELIIKTNGSQRSLLEKTRPIFSRIIKSLVAYLLQCELSPSTVSGYVSNFMALEPADIVRISMTDPEDMRIAWLELVASNRYRAGTLNSAKAYLRMLCDLGCFAWTTDHRHIIGSLNCPYGDKYSGVRSGDVFLSSLEEEAIVRFIDEQAREYETGQGHRSAQDVANCVALIFSYSFGMRPVQIASVRLAHVKNFTTENKELHSVSVKFFKAKQKRDGSEYPLIRKVKHEWRIIVADLHERRIRESPNKSSARLLGMDSAAEVSKRILRVTNELLGYPISATDLRHSFAQRLADAGASHEELAEAMGHSDIRTGLVYYRQTPAQAELINSALGISPVYQAIERIAHGRFISKQELLALKGEHQVAGVPHGIPISGIGGCSSGQPACPFNPVIACYGCNKFMPVMSTDVHRNALGSMRSVVQFFEAQSKVDVSSPAYLQLKRTINSIISVISEIEERSK